MNKEKFLKSARRVRGGDEHLKSVESNRNCLLDGFVSFCAQSPPPHLNYLFFVAVPGGAFINGFTFVYKDDKPIIRNKLAAVHMTPFVGDRQWPGNLLLILVDQVDATEPRLQASGC